MSATKSLTREQNDRVVSALKSLMQGRFRKNQNGLAEALGVSQPTLSELMSGQKGAGGKILIGLAKVAPEVALEIAGARTGTAVPADTLAMARAAAENLVNAGLATEEEAWRVMRGIQLHEPTVHNFYDEARRRLEGSATGEVDAPEAESKLSRASGPRGTRKR